MEKITISLIIPCYNSMKFIQETIDSCLNQSIYSNSELIIIDDGSSDGTKEYLNNLKDTNQKIKIIINKKNIGLVLSINKGIKEAKGEYISFIGHDDYFNSDHFEKMISAFKTNDLLMYCNSYLVNEKSAIIIDPLTSQKKMILESENQQKMIENTGFKIGESNFISSCGMVLKKSAVDAVDGWSTKYKLFGEWLFYTKLIRLGDFNFCDATIGYYRIHQTNISKTFNETKIKKELHYYYQDCRYSALKNKKLIFTNKIKILYSILKHEMYFKVKQILKK